MNKFYTVSAVLLFACIAGAAFSQTTKPAAAEPPAAWGKPADTPNDTLSSPIVTPDGRVTFRLYAPEAKNVTLSSNSDFFKGPLQFVKNDQGVDSYGIKYISEETPGGHVWANWRLYLSHLAPLLFC